MPTITIIFTEDERDEGLKLTGELAWRYPTALVAFAEGDEPDDDETAIDINHLLSQDNGLARKVDELVAQGIPRTEVMNELSSIVTQGNSIAALAIPNFTSIERDPTPPHGVARPVRIKSTDTTPLAKRIKQQVINEFDCPSCPASAGENCQSPKGQAYSIYSCVHSDRINAWYRIHGDEVAQ